MKSYGWLKDVYDPRDYRFPIPKLYGFPQKVDLRPKCPPVYDQGQLGSCTANAIAAAVEFERMAQSLPDFVPSRLFIYYNERAMEGSVSEDAGAQIRDGIKSVANLGACSETEWPYDVSQFAVQPPAPCYQSALQDKVIQYSSMVQSLNSMQTCLSMGFPFCFGFAVYDSFESEQVAQTGIVPMPRASENQLGGHAVLCVGYDNTTQQFIVRNSWSANWGLQGYMLMPFAYLLRGDLSSDFWNIKLVSRS